MPRGVDRYDEARLQGRLWTPQQLRANAKLYAWHDAADPSTIQWSSGVSQWSDKSGFGLHYVQTTAGLKPDYTALKSVDFSGFQRIGNAITMPGQYDYLIAATPMASTSTWRTLLWSVTNNHPFLLESGTNRAGVYASAFTAAGTNVLPSTRVLINLSVDASRNVAQSFDGGALTGTLATLTTSPVGVIGNENGGTQPFGSIHEAIMTANLTQRERQIAEGYLAWKWWGSNNTLPASHPYKNRPPLIGA